MSSEAPTYTVVHRRHGGNILEVCAGKHDPEAARAKALVSVCGLCYSKDPRRPHPGPGIGLAMEQETGTVYCTNCGAPLKVPPRPPKDLEEQGELIA